MSEKAPAYVLPTFRQPRIELTSRRQQTRGTLPDWLRVEYGIEKPSNKREAKG